MATVSLLMKNLNGMMDIPQSLAGKPPKKTKKSLRRHRSGSTRVTRVESSESYSRRDSFRLKAADSVRKHRLAIIENSDGTVAIDCPSLSERFMKKRTSLAGHSVASQMTSSGHVTSAVDNLVVLFQLLNSFESYLQRLDNAFHLLSKRVEKVETQLGFIENQTLGETEVTLCFYDFI